MDVILHGNVLIKTTTKYTC